MFKHYVISICVPVEEVMAPADMELNILPANKVGKFTDVPTMIQDKIAGIEDKSKIILRPSLDDKYPLMGDIGMHISGKSVAET